ncbi:hypothetical protein [Polyangium aurulentum]|uniref:hypothetical protein n=1 Tax=Polyangium aurulentum TaxID=2567896 RepID=UPI00146A43A9|nr:hypothetical protein [Polyangium aurulentum]UQA60875.1 hypothetical protein E8A73_010490 [Polyangium aurulentum]
MVDFKQDATNIEEETTLVSASAEEKLVATSAKEMEMDGAHDGCLRELFPY